MESGSALCSWAFNDDDPGFHGHKIADKVGCDQEDDEEVVECLKTKNYTEILLAGNEYKVCSITTRTFYYVRT